MRRTRSFVLAFAVIAIVVVVADQGTKAWALATFVEGERQPLLGDLLGLTLLFNSGAAFSLATGMTWVFTLVAVIMTVVVLRVAHRLGSRGWTVALGLLLGGAVGNLIDRLFREPGPARGHVVDFIAYGDLFVGNVADVAIVAAAGLMVLLGVLGIGLDGRRDTEEVSDEADGRAGGAAEQVADGGTSAAAVASPGEAADEAPSGAVDAASGDDVSSTAEAAEQR